MTDDEWLSEKWLVTAELESAAHLGPSAHMPELRRLFAQAREAIRLRPFEAEVTKLREENEKLHFCSVHHCAEWGCKISGRDEPR